MRFKDNPTYPNSKSCTENYTNSEGGSDESGHFEPLTQLNVEEQQMHPSLKPPKKKMQYKLEKRTNKNIFSRP